MPKARIDTETDKASLGPVPMMKNLARGKVAKAMRDPVLYGRGDQPMQNSERNPLTRRFLKGE